MPDRRVYINHMTEYMTMTADAPVSRSTAIKLYDAAGFDGMRKAGRLAAEILDALVPHVVPGVTTGELDDIVRRMTLDGGGVPATLGYRGYTHSCCISLNNVICHGIPGDYKLKDGDILNIDVTPLVDGWHGDTSRMFIAGDAPIKAKRLVEITYECLMLGIEQAKPGNHLGDIGHVIQRHAEKHRYGVVRDFCGHGLGRVFHDAPNVLHYGRPGAGAALRPDDAELAATLIKLCNALPKQTSSREIDALLRKCDEAVSTRAFLAGATLSVADVNLLPFLQRVEDDIPADATHLRGYMARARATPAFSKTVVPSWWWWW